MSNLSKKKAQFEVGTYVGSCCTIKIDENGGLTVYVSKDQLKTLSGPRNYNFHFVDGKLSGTGAWVAGKETTEGERLEKEFYKGEPREVKAKKVKVRRIKA